MQQFDCRETDRPGPPSPLRVDSRLTNGHPDDSREADEREEARRLRDLRGRVKCARAEVANTPALSLTLCVDWQEAGRFYARLGINSATV